MAKSEEKLIYEYGEDDFELHLLALLIRDKEFRDKNFSFLSSQFFTTDPTRDIFDLAKSFYERYPDENMTYEILTREISNYFKSIEKKDSTIDPWYEAALSVFGEDLSAKRYSTDEVIKFAYNQKMKIIWLLASKMGREPRDRKWFQELIEECKKALEIGSETMEAALPTFETVTKSETEWVVDRILPKQAITCLVGRSGLGKSHLIYLIGKCTVEGRPFFSYATQKMPVYYIDFENSSSVRWHFVQTCGRSEVKYWARVTEDKELKPPPRLDTESEWLIYKNFPPGLIIFDTLRSAQSANIQEDTPATELLIKLKELCAVGHTVVVLLHTLKSNDKTFKGNQVLMDLADHCLSLICVNKFGDEEEKIKQDDPAKPKTLWLVTREEDKSRYEKTGLYLNFDPSATEGDAFHLEGDQDGKDLLEINKRFLAWVHDTRAKKGADLEPFEYPNREQFEKMCIGWGFKQNRVRTRLIPRGMTMKVWGRDSITRSNNREHQYYFPIPPRKSKNGPKS